MFNKFIKVIFLFISIINYGRTAIDFAKQSNLSYIVKKLEEYKKFINKCEKINDYTEKEIIVIIPSYNNEKWCLRAIETAISQNYTNYKIIYRDDCSSDETYKIINNYVIKNNLQNKVIIKRNNYRRNKIANLYLTIHELDIEYKINDDSIILILDGDDHLPHEFVFKYINWLFHKDVWLTYGGYINYPSLEKGFDEPIPNNIINNNYFRKSKLKIGSQLRTFYAGLFRKIKMVDFIFQGKFFSMSSDIAKMMPMFEMSGNHTFHIDIPIYLYNRENTINDDKVNFYLQKTLATQVLLKKSYKRLNDFNQIYSDYQFEIDLILFLRKAKDVNNFFLNNQNFIKNFKKIIIINESELEFDINNQKNIEIINVKENFKNKIIEHLTNCSKYIFLCKENKNYNEINVKLATNMLKKTKAAGFYFNLNNRILKKYEKLGDNIGVWQFDNSNKEEFKKSYKIDDVIYNRDYLVKKISKIDFNSINELEKNFNNLNKSNLSKNIGLFFL